MERQAGAKHSVVFCQGLRRYCRLGRRERSDPLHEGSGLNRSRTGGREAGLEAILLILAGVNCQGTRTAPWGEVARVPETLSR